MPLWTEKGGFACRGSALILAICSPPGRFAGATQTRGYVGQDGRLHCVSPLLYEIGLVSLEISLDGGKTFPWSGTWTSGERLLCFSSSARPGSPRPLLLRKTWLEATRSKPG